MRAIAIILTLFAASPVAAQDGEAPTDFQAIGARGVEIFARDTAAWVATDAMLEAIPDPAAIGVQGWVLEPAGEGWKVTFVGDRDGRIVPIYEAWTVGRDVVDDQVLASDAPPVNAGLAQQFQARQAAMQTMDDVCGPSLNTVTIPIGEPSAPSAYDVYVISATSEPGVLVAGGHIRRRVSAEDMIVTERESFSASCLNIPLQPGAAGVQVSHLVSPEPNEIHVFLSLNYGLPFFVLTTTTGNLWSVNGPEITQIARPEQ